MRVLVAGATGFTGRRLVPALRAAGHDVTAFVRASSDPDVVRSLAVPVVPGDLADVDALARALAPVEALLCVASLGFGHAPGLVAAVGRAGGRRSVYVGTTAVRTTLPAPSKAVRLEAERVVLGGDVPATLLRPTMVYGAPGDRNLERLLRFVRRSPVVPVPGGGRGRMQPVHVDDLVAALVAVLPRADLAGRAFDVPGPTPLTFSELVRTVARVLDRRRLFPRVPRFVGRLVASREQLLRLDEDKSADPRPAADAFGFAPRPLEDGLRAEARALGLLSGASA